jgi:hypothetical protein
MIWRIDTYQNLYANNCSGIVTSRKRKLREIYAISGTEDAIPNSFATLEAPPTTTAETKFLELSDILQYVYYPIPTPFEVEIFFLRFGN